LNPSFASSAQIRRWPVGYGGLVFADESAEESAAAQLIGRARPGWFALWGAGVIRPVRGDVSRGG
jgi:hypothetical protein